MNILGMILGLLGLILTLAMGVIFVYGLMQCGRDDKLRQSFDEARRKDES